MIQATVKVDLSSMKKFEMAVQDGLSNPDSTNPVRDALKQWSARYRGFVRDRFDKYSKGGGDWKPLSLSTTSRRRDIRKRREKLKTLKKALHGLYVKGASAKKIKAKKAQIEKTLLGPSRKRSSLARTRKGKLVAAGGDGMQAAVTILRDTGTLFAALDPNVVGAPGSLSKMVPFGVEVGFGGPSRYPGGGPTIADIAKFHQEGNDRLPKREIIVEPPESVLKLMASDMERALAKIGE